MWSVRVVLTVLEVYAVLTSVLAVWGCEDLSFMTWTNTQHQRVSARGGFAFRYLPDHIAAGPPSKDCVAIAFQHTSVELDRASTHPAPRSSLPEDDKHGGMISQIGWAVIMQSSSGPPNLSGRIVTPSYFATSVRDKGYRSRLLRKSLWCKGDISLIRYTDKLAHWPCREHCQNYWFSP